MRCSYLTLSISFFSLPKKRPEEVVVVSVVVVVVGVEEVVVDVAVVVVVVEEAVVDVVVDVVLARLTDVIFVASWARSKLGQSTPISCLSEAALLYGLPARR